MTNKLLFNLPFANSTKTDLPAPGVPPVIIPSGILTGDKYLCLAIKMSQISSVALLASDSVNICNFSISLIISAILNTY